MVQLRPLVGARATYDHLVLFGSQLISCFCRLLMICLYKKKDGKIKKKRDTLEVQCCCLLLPVAKLYYFLWCLQVFESFQIACTVKLLQ